MANSPAALKWATHTSVTMSATSIHWPDLKFTHLTVTRITSEYKAIGWNQSWYKYIPSQRIPLLVANAGYCPPPNAYRRLKGSAYFQHASTEFEGSLRSRREQLAAFDCVLHELELSPFTRHVFSVVIELQAILRIMSPKHTFVTVIMDDVRRKEEGGMHLFMTMRRNWASSMTPL